MSGFSWRERLLFLQLQSRSDSLIIAETLLCLLFMVIGVGGNSAVIWIVYKMRHRRNMSYFLIGSLAISDVLLYFSTTWESFAVLPQSKWSLGQFICQFQGYSITSLTGASLLTMSLAAINRFFRVVKPNYYQNLFTPTRTKILILCSWTLAYMAPLPYLLSGRLYVFHPGKFFCFQVNELSFETLFIYSYLGVSMSVIIVCYYFIFKSIRRHQNMMKNMKNGAGTSLAGTSIEEIKATRTLFVTVVGYMICWTPILIIDIIDLIRGYPSMPRQVYVMYSYLGSTSSILNPFIYGALNRGFRNEYRKLLGCRRRRRSIAPVGHPRENGHCD